MTGISLAEPSVLVTIGNGIGRITLNRPKAINALDHEMVALIAGALTAMAGDDAVSAVVIDGAGGRGLCAGGDIKSIYGDAVSGGTGALNFWRDEYRLNRQIADYRKPVVAVMDGLVMGGGVGISAHASHRIVTERSTVAMPEVNIGLVPDVGGTFLLARSPGWLGLHAALTGIRLDAGDVIALGLADHYIDSAELTEFADVMAVHGPEAAIYGLAGPPPASDLVAGRDWIDDCYDASSPQQVLERLDRVGSTDAAAAAAAIRAASPLSVAVTFRAVRAVRASSAALPEALNQEFRMVSAALHSPDLIEGIRAAVIDKDRKPRWSIGSLAEVTDEAIDRYFAQVDEPPFPDIPTPVAMPSKEAVR